MHSHKTHNITFSFEDGYPPCTIERPKAASDSQSQKEKSDATIVILPEIDQNELLQQCHIQIML